MKIALAQLCVSQNKAENLTKAEHYIIQAKAAGVDMVVFPEAFMVHVPKGSSMLYTEVAESVEGPFVKALADLAIKHDLYVICGIYELKTGESMRVYNTTVVLNRQGQLIYRYRKTHLYDAFSFQESQKIIRGEEPCLPIKTDFGTIGVLVCYELRFPEISRRLALLGAEILIVPTAWVAGTMKVDHLLSLSKVRALENTVFMCVADQVGHHYVGHSVVYSPMGEALAGLGQEEGLLITEIELGIVTKTRNILPCLLQRHSGLY